jgi:DNA-binding NarL/FixJ family response regulator
MNTKSISVILVDNEEVFREGLARLLNEQPHIKVVFHCNNSQDAIQKSKEINPDIVLIDGHLSEGKILQTISDINKSSPISKVVTISRPGVGTTAMEILKAGAKACLAKSISIVDMVKSLELISSGKIIISNVFAETFLDEITGQKSGSDASETNDVLSERETEIAKLVAQGDSNKEIGEKLCISESTAKVHVKNILTKLELRNRQQLAVYAVLQNWVQMNATPPEDELNPIT